MIPIHNIYYMLSYAFKALRAQAYRSMETEKFDNVYDLCAEILIRGVSVQTKRGFSREYLEETEPLSTLRGRIEVSESIKTLSIYKKQLICSHDDFSVNSYLNRIIKSAMLLLIRSDIASNRKKGLKKLLVFFSEIESLDIHDINWKVRYNSNNQTYRLLIGICELAIKSHIQTRSAGASRQADFFDEQKMSRLYEKFILEYYRREIPQISAASPQIPWGAPDAALLPVMQSDVTLTCSGKTLIIDAKYYSHTTQERFGVHTLHSHNLYQIFTYVKNKEYELEQLGKEHKVSGMLLYAKTDEEILPDNAYTICGNDIIVRTLDLNRSFSEIKAQLDNIAYGYFCLAPA